MQSENTAGANQTNEQPGIEHLAELLTEEDSGEAGNNGAGAQGEERGSEQPKPTKFNDLAGKLGLELDDLYKLEVSQAEDGTPVTVENLKDYYGKQADLSLREIEFEERRTKTEADLMQAVFPHDIFLKHLSQYHFSFCCCRELQLLLNL